MNEICSWVFQRIQFLNSDYNWGILVCSIYEYVADPIGLPIMIMTDHLSEQTRTS